MTSDPAKERARRDVKAMLSETFRTPAVRNTLLSGPKKVRREEFLIGEIARRLVLDGWEVTAELMGYSRPDETQRVRPDLVALRDGEKVFIEIKSGASRRERVRLAHLRSWANTHGGQLIVVDAHPTATKPNLDKRASKLQPIRGALDRDLLVEPSDKSVVQ